MKLKSSEHGWLLPELLKLDDEYQGRWEQWRWTMETGEIPKDIPQTEFLDLGNTQTLQMVKNCLQAIPQGSWGSHSRFILYFALLIPSLDCHSIIFVLFFTKSNNTECNWGCDFCT